MLNVVLSIIVFYYLVKTGDLFKLIKMGKKLVQDFFDTLKKDKQVTEENRNPLEILKLRYVQGEIDKAEYEQIVKNL